MLGKEIGFGPSIFKNPENPSCAFGQVKFILQLKKSSETGEKYLDYKQENPVP